MGNCIDLFFSPCYPSQEKIKVLIFNGGEEEFKASTPVDQITSGPYQGYKLVHHAQPDLPLPSDRKLMSGELYHLIPQITVSCSPPIPQKIAGTDSWDAGGHTIKVIVTKKQLAEILSSSGVELPPFDEFAVQVMERCQKWRPSLATIPELQIC